MRCSDKWESLAEVLRAIEPDLEMKLAYCRANPPDPVKQPVTSAVVAAYISRVELVLASIRRGAKGLKDQCRDRPGLTEEIREIESLIFPGKSRAGRPKLTTQDELATGDWFVSEMGYSYSKTNRSLGEMRRSLSGRGAPNKRPDTLKILDERICNNRSYQELSRMCDCESSTHNHYCEERIRQRVRDLEAILTEYGITYFHTRPDISSVSPSSPKRIRPTPPEISPLRFFSVDNASQKINTADASPKKYQQKESQYEQQES